MINNLNRTIEYCTRETIMTPCLESFRDIQDILRTNPEM